MRSLKLTLSLLAILGLLLASCTPAPATTQRVTPTAPTPGPVLTVTGPPASVAALQTATNVPATASATATPGAPAPTATSFPETTPVAATRTPATPTAATEPPTVTPGPPAGDTPVPTATPGPLADATSVPEPTVVRVTTTAVPTTAPMATAGIATAVPATTPDTTPRPVPTPVPPTPIPTLSSGLPPTELKYRVLAQFPTMFYCDPDYYPVARADEMDVARQRFPELQANQEEFQAILKHNGLTGFAAFTDQQKLLIYREHKKLTAIIFEPSGDRYQFQLQIEESKGQGFIVKGLIDGNGSITVQQRQASFTSCPICLAAETLIDTPQGPVAVQDLRPGDAVWTADGTGARLAAVILRTVRASVPANHEVIHVVLNDGRELRASPGHPTADGRSMADLRQGDLLDGALISSVDRVSYGQPATYDILPSGETGFYWANRILVGSTLAGR